MRLVSPPLCQIIAYARYSGIVDKLRMVARRGFGFHSADTLIAMLFLTCGGVQLQPRLPRTDPHERLEVQVLLMSMNSGPRLLAMLSRFTRRLASRG
jgi:hypothetical protein